METATAVKAVVTPIPSAPKAAQVKCPGCAQALLKGGKCAAHGDPVLAHANGAAATGDLGKGAPRIRGAELTKLAKGAATKVKATKAEVREGGDDMYAHSRGDKTDTIKLLTTENPKTPGSKSYRRFGLYKNGMSVAEALEAGIKSADIRWDMAHNYIELK